MNARCQIESAKRAELAALPRNAVHQHLCFHPDHESGERFALDTVDQCLWKYLPEKPDRRIPLTPKAFAVLKYLVDNAGRLISHEEFLEAVWPGVYIQPEGLKSQILALRSALEDDARNPSFIEALPRRGYRFIARIAADGGSDRTEASASTSFSLIGRERPLSELRAILQRSIGQRQREIVFVTGEPGIGKTTLVDEFARLARREMPQALFARGQCVEGFGGKEAYYPMLEALGDLCRGERGTQVLRALASCAPAWLAQFPAFRQPSQRPELQGELTGAGRERMLRELKDVCERLCSDAPVILVLEDLQWSDSATVDFIEVLARTRTPMRLLVIGTYRPGDLTTGDHQLRTLEPQLQLHRLCHELPLDPLTEDQVAAFMAAQAPAGLSIPDGLAGLIHRRTEGNPLFMVTLLDHLSQRGLLANIHGAWQICAPLASIENELPETLREMIDARVDRLSGEEQRALEVACIAGIEFDPQACADAAGLEPERMEEMCRALGGRHFILRRSDSGAIGTPRNAATRFEFVHAMYREVLYGRLAPARRARLHLALAQRPEPAGLGTAEPRTTPGLVQPFELGSRPGFH